jgi:RNA polymerase sigma factor FliA
MATVLDGGGQGVATRSAAAGRDELITSHLGLVYHVARKLSRSLSSEMELDELVSAGTIGLMNAISKFEPERGLAFSTFAAPRIRGAILDELRKHDHLPRSVRRKNREYSTAREKLSRRLGREPRDQEVADYLDIDMKTYWRWQSRLEASHDTSYDQPWNEVDPRAGSLADVLADDDGSGVEDMLNLEQEADHLRNAILQLNEQERLVLSCYYFEELKLSQIAEIMGLSEARISQIRAKAVSRLRTMMAPLRTSSIAA